MMNYLETTYFQTSRGLPGIADAEKRARMDRSSSEIRMRIYSEFLRGTGDERSARRLHLPAEDPTG